VSAQPLDPWGDREGKEPRHENDEDDPSAVVEQELRQETDGDNGEGNESDAPERSVFHRPGSSLVHLSS
jgi:hypothetical protein